VHDPRRCSRSCSRCRSANTFARALLRQAVDRTPRRIPIACHRWWWAFLISVSDARGQDDRAVLVDSFTYTVAGVVLRQLRHGAAFCRRTMPRVVDHLSSRPGRGHDARVLAREGGLWLVTLPASRRACSQRISSAWARSPRRIRPHTGLRRERHAEDGRAAHQRLFIEMSGGRLERRRRQHDDGRARDRRARSRAHNGEEDCESIEP